MALKLVRIGDPLCSPIGTNLSVQICVMGRCGGQNGSHSRFTTMKRKTSIVGATLVVARCEWSPGASGRPVRVNEFSLHSLFHSPTESCMRKSTATKGLDNLEKEYYTRAMIIGVSQITLHLPDSQSLKDKRQIIKSILARVRNRFEVAIAEVEEQDRWQIAVLGLSCVSNSKQHSEEILERVRRYIEETRPDIVVSNVETEMITW